MPCRDLFRANSIPALRALAVWTLFIGVTLLLQFRNNAFSAELTSDDASHYVSGLMIHDYLVSGLKTTPTHYLVWFHAHYPLVGIGHWGPFYYLVEGLWMLVASPGIPAAVLLSTVVTASTAFLVYAYGVDRLRLERIYAVLAAILFIVTPIIQLGSATVMLDIPVTLLVIAATYVYAGYLETEKAIYSILFGFTAAAAILTKGNGALLALLPPLAVVATGRWSLLRRPAFWAPALIVGLLAGPWYVVTYGQVAAGFRFKWGLDYSTIATRENARIALANLGWPLLGLALVGLVASVRNVASPRGVAGRTLACLLLAVWLFQTVVPAAIQDRYLAPLIAPVALFAALGAQTLVARLSAGRSPLGWRATAAALVLLLAVPAALQVPRRPSVGVREMAKLAWSQQHPSNRVVLIGATGGLEAAAIAELAMADPDRPSLFAVRGSRLLGAGGYNDQDYLPKFATASQVGAELERMRVPLVLYKAERAGWKHLAQLGEVRTSARPPWRLVGHAGASSDPVSLYALPAADTQAADVQRWVSITAPQHLGPLAAGSAAPPGERRAGT